MAIDPDVLSQINTAHVRAIHGAAMFQQALDQRASHLNITSAETVLNDTRTQSAGINQTIFGTSVMDNKTAFQTPTMPGVMALPPKQAAA